MRRAALLIFIGIFVFAGCKGNDTGIFKLSDISFTADIVAGKLRYRAECIISGEHELTVVMRTPEILNGLKFTVNNNRFDLSRGDISFNAENMNLPDNFIIRTLYEIIKKSDRIKFVSTKGQCKVEGDVRGKRYIFSVSPVGLPLMLKIPDEDVKISFYNVSVIK